MRLFCILSLLLLASLSSPAQKSITGIWRGYFIQKNEMLPGKFITDRYKYEIQINNLKNNAIQGVTYSYKTTVFYGKSSIQGIYTPSTTNLILKETKMLDLKITDGSEPCLMTCYLEYSKEGNKEYLKGSYTSINEKSKGDCGGGTVFLERVTTTEFEKEPFLLKSTPKTTPPPVAATKPANKLTTGNTNKSTSKSTITNKPKIKPGAEDNMVNGFKPNTGIVPTVGDTIAQQKTITTPIKPVKPIVIPKILTQRKNDLMNTVKVDVQEVQIDFYDNGQIDNDSISVYHNNVLVVNHQRLSYTPITIKIHLSADDPIHEIITVADNLGDVPPNTALMVITFGKKRKEVTLTSDEQTNAKVILEYAP